MPPRKSNPLIRSILPFLVLASAHAAEAEGVPPPTPAQLRHFDEVIAPILSKHCLECHDTAIRKGKVDLSRPGPALHGIGGERAIIAGDAAASPAWESIESGDMPHERDPLSAEEMALLREWIDRGAVWSGDLIDPLSHTRDRRAGQPWLRRLTLPEYIASVRTALGVDIAREATERLPPDPRADGFSNTAYNLTIDLGHVEAYASLAETVAARVDPAALAGRFTTGQGFDDRSSRELISRMGGWVLRGPLEDREIESYLGVVHAVREEKGDRDEAIRFLVEAMVQSPRFLYRMESRNLDGKEARPVSAWELASRLSYLIWGAPPDEALHRSAMSGGLTETSEIDAQVTRMLADPRSIDRSIHFISDWLNLDRLSHLRPDPARFPKWNSRLGQEMREETLAVFRELVWKRNLPLSGLINAPFTVITPELARHYGLDPGAAITASAAHPKQTIGDFNVPRRSGPDLVALYTFDESSGDVIKDKSGHPELLDLKINRPGAVKWNDGSLTVESPVLITSRATPDRLTEAVRLTNEITVEAWITPSSSPPDSLGRIITISQGTSLRNFTLGQEGSRFSARIRSRDADNNGLPGLDGPGDAAQPGQPVHLALTSNLDGHVIFYVNGRKTTERRNGRGFPRWDGTYLLALANETSGDRPWTGTYHQIAIHNRALSPDEIRAVDSGPLRFDLAKTPHRRGILTHGSVLTMGGDDASTVTRGLFVLKEILFSGVTNAPPGTDTTPVPPKPGQSRRAIAQTRLDNKSCVACHAKFEPLAFAFEKYDGLGAFSQTDEHDNSLREDGSILFPGERDPVAYRTTAEFLDLLAGHDRVKENMTRKLVQFAIGRPLVPADNPAVTGIHRRAWNEGGTYQALIRAIALSPLVRELPPESTPTPPTP